MDWPLFWEWAIKGLVLILTFLVGFGYLTYYERRFLARLQSRLGPNRAGPYGLMQWMADAVKLIFKEELTPDKAYKLVFFLAPVITMVPSIVIAAVIPWGPSVTAVWAHLHAGCSEHQCGCAVPDVHRFDCSVRYRAGGLVVEQQIRHDGRFALYSADDLLRTDARPFDGCGDLVGQLDEPGGDRGSAAQPVWLVYIWCSRLARSFSGSRQLRKSTVTRSICPKPSRKLWRDIILNIPA